MNTSNQVFSSFKAFFATLTRVGSFGHLVKMNKLNPSAPLGVIDAAVEAKARAEALRLAGIAEAKAQKAVLMEGKRAARLEAESRIRELAKAKALDYAKKEAPRRIAEYEALAKATPKAPTEQLAILRLANGAVKMGLAGARMVLAKAVIAYNKAVKAYDAAKKAIANATKMVAFFKSEAGVASIAASYSYSC